MALLTLRLGLPEGALNPELALEALRHGSYAHERSLSPGREVLRSNERLEFLGDAVLGFLIARRAWEKFPDAPEGELTRLRAGLVREESLALVARKLGPRAALAAGPRRGAQRREGERRPAGRRARGGDRGRPPVLWPSAHRGGGGARARAALCPDRSLAGSEDGAAAALPEPEAIAALLRARRRRPRPRPVLRGGGAAGRHAAGPRKRAEQEGGRTGRRPRGAGGAGAPGTGAARRAGAGGAARSALGRARRRGGLEDPDGAPGRASRARRQHRRAGSRGQADPRFCSSACATCRRR